jgi:hypothetical protein
VNGKGLCFRLNWWSCPSHSPSVHPLSGEGCRFGSPCPFCMHHTALREVRRDVQVSESKAIKWHSMCVIKVKLNMCIPDHAGSQRAATTILDHNIKLLPVSWPLDMEST